MRSASTWPAATQATCLELEPSHLRTMSGGVWIGIELTCVTRAVVVSSRHTTGTDDGLYSVGYQPIPKYTLLRSLDLFTAKLSPQESKRYQQFVFVFSVP